MNKVRRYFRPTCPPGWVRLWVLDPDGTGFGVTVDGSRWGSIDRHDVNRALAYKHPTLTELPTEEGLALAVSLEERT